MWNQAKNIPDHFLALIAFRSLVGKLTAEQAFSQYGIPIRTLFDARRRLPPDSEEQKLLTDLQNALMVVSSEFGLPSAVLRDIIKGTKGKKK